MGLFSKLFKKKQVFSPADLSVLQTDVHSHFIPGIDDGAETMDDSLTLIRSMKEFGYKKVITTPHIMSDHYKNTPEIILGGLEKVREAVNEEGIDIEIEAAAEYYLDFGFLDLIEEGNLLTWGDNYVLFEMGFLSEAPMFADATFKMQLAGYRPVLAHAERYSYWYQDYNKYQEILDKGVLLQLNIGSITGYYSPLTKKIAERMIDDDLFQFLGSDCHHIGHVGLYHDALTEEYLHKILDSGSLLNNTL